MQKQRKISFNIKATIFFVVTILFIIPISLLIYRSMSDNKNFVLANYQSYISPMVKDRLEKKFGLSFDYFESPESAKVMVKKNTADIINTTSYELVNWAHDGIIQKIDWSKFSIDGIKCAKDALSLFTTPVQNILQSYDIDGDGIKDNILDYGVPYFMQDLVFVYRGKEIEELKNGITWEELFKIISSDDRFKNKNEPKLIALNDPRTMYSIPREIQSDNINPESNSSIDNLEKTYKLLANEFNSISNNSVTFNSDSNVILNKVATGEVNGAFCFNGDALYATNGGDYGLEIDPNDIHVVKPENNLVALDLFTFNKKLDDNYLDKAYSVLKDLCLNFNDKDVNNSLAYENFEYVQYTSPLKKLNDYIDINSDFTNEQKDILRISDNNIQNRLEIPLDDITKSNLSFAWVGFKSYLR